MSRWRMLSVKTPAAPLALPSPDDPTPSGGRRCTPITSTRRRHTNRTPTLWRGWLPPGRWGSGATESTVCAADSKGPAEERARRRRRGQSATQYLLRLRGWLTGCVYDGSRWNSPPPRRPPRRRAKLFEAGACPRRRWGHAGRRSARGASVRRRNIPSARWASRGAGAGGHLPAHELPGSGDHRLVAGLDEPVVVEPVEGIGLRTSTCSPSTRGSIPEGFARSASHEAVVEVGRSAWGGRRRAGSRRPCS